jgi:hypothetical protein
MEVFAGIRRHASISVKPQEHSREENPMPRHLQTSILREYGTRVTVTSVRSRKWNNVCTDSKLQR